MTAFETTPRGRSLTRQQRAKLFLAHGGVCYICARKLGSGDRWEAEHVWSLGTGGPDDKTKLAVVCVGCHLEKTRADHKTAAKGRAVATALIVPTGVGKRGRPMPGTKRSGVKKGFDGVPRDRATGLPIGGRLK